MNKKLLTVAIGAALGSAPMFASADVKVYGAAQVEIGQVECGTVGCGPNSMNTTKPTAGNDLTFVTDAKRGRIGVAADEDLGGGFKGLAKFEWNLDTADNIDGPGGSVFAARDSWVGVQSKTFGTLRLGQSGTPYKQSGVALDPWITTALEARNNYGMSGNKDGYGVLNAHNGFNGNGIHYATPGILGGAYVNLYVGADGGDSTNGDLSAVAGWKGKVGIDLNVFAGYSQNNNAHTAAIDEPTAMKVGASIGIAKMHVINLQYEKIDASIIGAGSDPSADYLYLNYQLKIGGLTATASFGQMKDEEGTTEQEGTYIAAGVLYNFTKTFRIHAGWRSTERENTVTGAQNMDETAYSVGMRKDF